MMLAKNMKCAGYMTVNGSVWAEILSADLAVGHLLLDLAGATAGRSTDRQAFFVRHGAPD